MPRLAPVGAACLAALVAGAPTAAASGNLDNSFGPGGALVLSVGDGGQSAGNGIAVAPGGGLRVAGEAIDGPESKFAFLRLDANGALLGTTLTSLGGDAAGAALFTQADGKSLVAGYGSGVGTGFGFARYLDDGSLDTAGFGSGGPCSARLATATTDRKSVV